MPPKFTPALPASVAIEAVSRARIVMSRWASSLVGVVASAVTPAVTVLRMVLIANEPPKARLPSPEPANPTTTLRTLARSVALTVIPPADDVTPIRSIVALTLFLTSFSPIEAPSADPLSEMARVPAPDSTRDESFALTATPPAADTDPVPVAVREMRAATLLRTKLSEIAPAPLIWSPPPPPTVTLVICDDSAAAGSSSETSPMVTLLFITANSWFEPLPTLVRKIGRRDPSSVSSVSWRERASWMCVGSITIT